ncbi:MAG: hypothetical protein COV48_16445, partial [Elusimicrobia bacterium CG11_big_fil_rev_8_21_14_0_20_64_6]
MRRLEALGHAERLENLSRRFPLPHFPSRDLESFRLINAEELRSALRLLEEAGGPEASAWRGRVRRLLG